MNKGIIAALVLVAIIIIAAAAYVLMTQHTSAAKAANSTTTVSAPATNHSANTTQTVRANKSTGTTSPPPPPNLPPNIATTPSLSIGPSYTNTSSIYPGQSAQLTGSAATGGTSPYVYQWWERMPSQSAYTPISGATSTSYIFKTPSATTTGTYYFELQASDSQGAYVFSNTISIVIEQVSNTLSVSLSATPSTLTQGNTLTLNVSISGSTATPFQIELYQGTSSTCSQDTINKASGTTNTQSLAIPLTSASAAYPTSSTYYCVRVHDNNGNVAYSPTTLVTTPPPLTVSASASTTSIYSGNPVTLTATASGGVSPYSYLWHVGTSSVCSSDTVEAGNVQSITVNPTLGQFYGSEPYYCVTATDGTGTTALSSTVGIKINNEPPTTTTSTIPSTTTVAPTTTNSITTTVAPTTTISSTTTVAPTISSNTISLQQITLNIQPGWNLLSVPLLPAGAVSSDLSGIVYTQLQSNCGLSTNTNAGNLWGYSNSAGHYTLFDSIGSFENYTDYSSAGTSSPIGGYPVSTGGNGFWFYSANQCSINIPAVSANDVSQIFAETLPAGWNLIGTPFITTTNFSTIASSCNVRGSFYGYDPAMNNYYNATTPAVGVGYFVYLESPCNIDWTSGTSSSGSLPPSTP